MCVHVLVCLCACRFTILIRMYVHVGAVLCVADACMYTPAALADFGTFSQCDQQKHRACMGNQMIFRASFSISAFFLVHTALSRSGATSSSRVPFWTLFAAELPLFVALLVGSFFIPSSTLALVWVCLWLTSAFG